MEQQQYRAKISQYKAMGNYFFSDKHEVKVDSVKECVCVREGKRDRWLAFGVCVFV